jgi:hypothetical protein
MEVNAVKPSPSAKADYAFVTLDGYKVNGINDSGQIVGSNNQGASCIVAADTPRSTCLARAGIRLPIGGVPEHDMPVREHDAGAREAERVPF